MTQLRIVGCWGKEQRGKTFRAQGSTLMVGKLRDVRVCTQATFIQTFLFLGDYLAPSSSSSLLV